MTYTLREFARVTSFKDSLDRGDTEAIGQLLDESWKDFEELYEGSVAEVEKLVKVCKDAGSRGSKTTGLGWGGCVVSLIESEKAADFVSKVESVISSPKA